MNVPPSGSPSSEVEALLDTVDKLAKKLAELEAQIAGHSKPMSALGFTDEKLRAIATSMTRMRRWRRRYFDSGLLSEPAWEMLLDLFINRVQGRRVSTTSLCLAAEVPQATGLRWIATLEKQGLVRRFRASDDARVKLVEITSKGFEKMRRFLSDSAAQFDAEVG